MEESTSNTIIFLKQRQSLPNASTKLPTHCLMPDTPLLCGQNRVSTIKNSIDNGSFN